MRHAAAVVFVLAVSGLALVGARHVLGDDTTPIDLDVKDQDVNDVIAEIRKLSGYENIVVEKGVHEKVTVQLNRVGWRDALNEVARKAGCRVEEQGAGVLMLKKAGAAPAKGPGKEIVFREYPIGDEVQRPKERLKIAAVYLPPVTMDHEHGAPAPGPDTIHLECDVHAIKGNENGFGIGEWIPYLTVEYTITKDGDTKPSLTGELMPMVAKDGPHYGATIALPEHAKYKLVYKLYPPSRNGFGRHTDSVTGVADWWKEFEVSFSWDWKGLDKK